MSEADLARHVRQVLATMGCVVTRHQCGNIFVGGRVIKMGEPGWPDILGFMGDGSGRLLGVELKVGKGKERPAQTEWLARAAAAGCCVATVRSVDEAVAFVQAAKGRAA